MNKPCIYCGKKEPDVTFKGSEHVIPAFIGGTKALMLDKLVCDSCNSGVFSRFESEFKQNSLEGIVSSMLNLKNDRIIKLENDLSKFKLVIPDRNIGEFSKVFPRFTLDGSAEFRAQVHLKDEVSGKYELIWVENLAEGDNKTINKLEYCSNKNVQIYGDGVYSIYDIVDLLKKYNFTVELKNEKQFPFKGLDPRKPIRFEIEWNYSITQKMLRLPLKIAFNYFAFCALKSNLENVIYCDNFNYIKKFILGQIDKLQYSDCKINDKPFIKAEDKNVELSAFHFIVLSSKDGVVMANVTLFNTIYYQFKLGKYPFAIMPEQSFGCGSCFNPFTGEVFKMRASTNNEKPILSYIGAPEYYLFSR